MRLSLLRVDLLPDVFDFHRIRANHDRCEICVDNISDDSRCERVMRFAVAGDAIFGAHTDDDHVFLDRLSAAATGRVFEPERQRKSAHFTDDHAVLHRVVRVCTDFLVQFMSAAAKKFSRSDGRLVRECRMSMLTARKNIMPQ